MTSNKDMNVLAEKLFDSAAIFDQLSVDHSGQVRTRFAPSPNGFLHAGHALSAVLNRDFAQYYKGEFLLRIEDIDAGRSRLEYVDMILKDMRWLYLTWQNDVIYQSMRIDSYRSAFERLRTMELLYPCFCSRGDIAKALGENPVKHGPDGPHYPGTCRGNSQNHRMKNEPYSWRLDMDKALAYLSPTKAMPLKWFDCEHGEQKSDPSLFGDVVIWRKDAPASYHLAATCDDAADGITHVIRGMDLFAYTAVHRLLQELLGLRVPQYWHHKLLMGADGEKLSKSRNSQSLNAQRNAGVAPSDVMKLSK